MADVGGTNSLVAIRGARILVTGALGAIGDALVTTLRESGATVVGMDVRTPADAAPFHRFVCADIRDSTSVDAAIREADAVAHLAAWVHRQPRDSRESEMVFAVNQGSTEGIAAACASHGKRLVFASTVAVYGETARGRLDESAVTCPETPYAQSKLAAESSVLAAKGVVLRLPMVYGARDRGNMRQMIRAISRGWFVVPGKGKARRSLLGRWNAARAFACALAAHHLDSHLFNVADEEVVSVGQMSHLVAELAGSPAPWHVPLPLLRAAGLAGGVLTRATGVRVPLTTEAVNKLTRELIFETTLVRRELGYLPARTLREGLAEEVDWCRRGEPS